MEIFDVPGLTLRHELKAGDLGRLIEFSGIYGHSDFDYPIAFEGYVAETFAEYVIDPKPLNRIWMVEDEQGLVGTIGVVDRGDTAQSDGFLSDLTGEKTISENFCLKLQWNTSKKTTFKKRGYRRFRRARLPLNSTNAEASG